MNVINVGIVGYGNLGRGVEKALLKNSDFCLKAIFTRRNTESFQNEENPLMVHISKILEYKGKIDVMILCGGSATDLPVQGPELAAHFNTVDSFDTHAKIPEYFAKVDKAAKDGGNLAIISVGWDPGLFSLNRLLAQAVLPTGVDYTFWGKGVSQGHSDAIRRITGVKNGIQYTVPVAETLDKVRKGDNPTLTARDGHLRICYVVAEEGADKKAIEKEIVEMPNYFEPYNTTVHFISEEELKANHSGMPHGGFVIRSGETSVENKQKIEFQLTLDSNPEFTGSVLVAFARGIYRMAQEGQTGGRTVFDVPYSYIINKSRETLLKELL